jgi:iron complex transport system ATP-binding protein
MTALLDARGLGLPGRLRPTDLAMETPQLLCLVGPNGSGKTSLLHATARIGAAAGTVRIDGADVGALAPAARLRTLAYLPASRDIAWPLSAEDLVRLGSADAVSAEDAMAVVDVADLRDRRLDRLSSGERSRVLIARAFAQRPSTPRERRA